MKDDKGNTKNREMNSSRTTTIGLQGIHHSGTGYGHGITIPEKTGEKKVEQTSGSGNLGSGIPDEIGSQGDVI